MDRGEFQDLNLRHKTAHEVWQRVFDKNTVLAKMGLLTTVHQIEESRALARLQDARRDITLALIQQFKFSTPSG